MDPLLVDQRAIDLCRATLARGSRSFNLAARLLPADKRDLAAAVYAWCRIADDAIDLAPPGEQPAALAQLRHQLGELYVGEPQSDPRLAAFQAVVHRCGIPAHYPSELLAGMEMDALEQRYESWDDLLLYCFRVAGTVGLMMCHVFQVEGAWALRHAAHLGMAMQLTNIARDVREDWHRGRLYLPRQLLGEVGLGDLPDQVGGPLPRTARVPLGRALGHLLDRAERLYQSGDAGLPALDLRTALSIRAARAIYAAIGEELARTHYDVFAPRAVVPPARKAELVGRALWLELKGVAGRTRGPRQTGTPSRELRYPADILPI